jgi:cell division protein FtsQ
MLKLWLLSCWNKPALLNILAGLILGGALFLMGMTGASWIQRHPWFNITELVVTGMRGSLDLSHQRPKFIKRHLMPRISGNFFTVNLSDVQKVFQDNPWTRHVVVRRVWPNRLWVTIEEHQAVAKLNDDLLVNAQGELFLGVSNPTKLWQHLPQFYGDKADIQVIQTQFAMLNQWLSPKKITVRQLYFSERRAWIAVLSNNITLEIGRDDLKPSTEIRVNRWINTWDTTRQIAQLKSNARIDLRYPNGYAVSKGYP